VHAERQKLTARGRRRDESGHCAYLVSPLRALAPDRATPRGLRRAPRPPSILRPDNFSQVSTYPADPSSPIPGFHRHQGGCHHLAFRSHPRQLPVQRVACRTRLITKPQLFHRPQFLHQLPNRFFAIRYHPQRPNLPVLLRHGYGRAARSPDCARAAASLPNAYAASDFTSKPGGES
jgi:hypothetical protein